jgi:hypothetical protein
MICAAPDKNAIRYDKRTTQGTNHGICHPHFEDGGRDA